MELSAIGEQVFAVESILKKRVRKVKPPQTSRPAKSGRMSGYFVGMDANCALICSNAVETGRVKGRTAAVTQANRRTHTPLRSDRYRQKSPALGLFCC